MNERHTERSRTTTRSDESGRAGTGSTRQRARRFASMAVGGALLVGGLRRRSLGGTALALVGAGLIARGIGGLARSRGTGGMRPAAEDRRDQRRDQRRDETGRSAARRSITVDASPERLHEVWRDPDELSRIAGDFVAVTAPGEDRLRWTIDGPFGRDLAWETLVVEESVGEVLRWETPPDATIPNEGSIRFAPAAGDRGTVVTLAVSVDPPGGTLGDATLERLRIVPEAFVGRALDRFKSLVESGEIPTLAGNPSGRGRGGLV